MKPFSRWWTLPLAALAALPSIAGAREYTHKWWLPSDYSTHGHEIDSLFNWIFWITTITFVAVQLTLVVFLIKYRYNPKRKKAVFTHGNQRLEMFWTIAPAIILAVLALGSKKVWDNFRYSDYENDPNKQTVLVVGQQFKWNTIYPGPDGKLGAYLVFPKPTDKAWSNPAVYERARANAKAVAEGRAPDESEIKPFIFANVAGPAFLPFGEARKAISAYMDQVNPLGKVFEDPAGLDDDWEKQPGREMVIAKDRPVEVQLSSKDVIHDFFLPNFRVKLDAVPGMRGKLHFQATKTSRDREQETLQTYKVDDLPALLAKPATKALTIRIDENSPGTAAQKNKDRIGWRYVDPTSKARSKPSIIRDGGGLTETAIAKLKSAGVTEVQAYLPGTFELVCEELCGQGHATMKGQIRVVTQEELDSRKDYELYDKPTSRTLASPGTRPSTLPTAVGLAR